MSTSKFFARSLMVLGLAFGASAVADETYNVTVTELLAPPGVPITLVIQSDALVAGRPLSIFEGGRLVSTVVLQPIGNVVIIPNIPGTTVSVSGPEISAKFITVPDSQ